DAQAELLWTAAITSLEVVGDDQATLACSQRLESLLPKIRDPYLHVVSQLAVAGVSAVVGDFDGALRQESASLEELRGQDEPYWTTVAILTLGLVETARGTPRRPSATCARRGPWRNGSITPVSVHGPRCSWASWPSCGAGPRRPGRCWTRGWS